MAVIRMLCVSQIPFRVSFIKSKWRENFKYTNRTKYSNHTIPFETDFLLCVCTLEYKKTNFIVLNGQELPPMEFVVRSKSVLFGMFTMIVVGPYLLSNERRRRKTI